MTNTATVTLKKGEETVKRDITDEAPIKAGNTYVIGGETWTVDKVHGKEPEKQPAPPEKPARPDLIESPKPQPKPKPEAAKAAPAKHHTAAKKSSHSHRR